MDTVSEKKRSEIMSKVRSNNTKPEVLMKKALAGLRFRYQPTIRGKPDFASKKYGLAIFIDGCFWHGCPKCCRMPKSNRAYWNKKISGNVKRDKNVTDELEKEGWLVIRFWEHEIKEDLKSCVKKIKKAIT